METLAKDVTEEYELVHETEEKNKKIASLNQQLKAYSQTIDSFIREKELLAAKRKIHDDMGRTLILLRLYMENEDKKAEDRKELLNLWRQNLVLLKGGIKNPDKGSSWDKLIGAARGAGIDLDLKGSLPSEKKTLGLLTEILHEAINNAILHGQAKTLFLDIVEDKMTYTFTIRNDGLRPLGPLVEKGGLKNIRRRVEMEGGSLYITGNPDFLMQIVLRKEVSHDI